jgi:hypothetical protein
MINVNQITSQLAKMPDQALQQYASMHKNDPYTVALALAESNRRKQMRTGAQMGPGQQAKVVDQEIAGIAAPQQALPEDTGIAQLPAQNIQGMAGGGIVAFEEGGEVPGYATGDLIYDPSGAVVSNDASGQTGDDLTIMERLGIFNPENRRALERASKKPQQGTSPSATYTRPGMRNDPRLPEGFAPKTVKEQEPSEPLAKKEKAATTPVKAAAAPASGIEALATGYKPSSAEDLMKTARTLSADANKESEAAYKPYAEMLQKERSELDARKGDNKNMALLQAGLSILGGTSANPFENIGKGATQGLAAFQEAKRLDDASKKALMASEIAMMQAQRAERSGNHKDAVALVGQAEQSNQFGINAGLKAEEIKNTKAYQQGMVGVYRDRNAMLGAGAKHEEKKMAEFGKIQQQVLKSLANDMTYAGLKTDAEREAYKTKLLRAEMMNNPFLAASAANIGFVPAPTGGTQRGDYTDMER